MNDAEKPPFFGALYAPASPALRYMAFACVMLGYLAIRFVFFDWVPEKLLQDSGKILDMVASQTDVGSSFGMTARVLALAPDWFWVVTNVALSAGIAGAILIYGKTYRAVALAVLLLPPLILLNLLVPSKETIVLMMTSVTFFIGCRYGPVTLVASIAAMYLVYGAGVRTYYVLILAVLFALLIAAKLPRWTLYVLAMAALIALWVIPPEILVHIQSQRDNANTYAQYIAQSNNRTAFFNLLPPEGAWAFLVNYGYAAAILNFPILAMGGDPKDFLLFLNVLIYAWLVRVGHRCGNQNAAILAKLFLAHVLVLWLFEPDLGSYFRHFSSALPLLLLGFVQWETKTIETQKTVSV